MKKLCLMWIFCVALPSWASDKELTADPRVATALGLLDSIVAPAIEEALDAPEKGTAMDPAFEMYTGTYLGGWGGELVVLPWKDSLGLVFLPTDNPADQLIPLKHDEGHSFRRVRKDGELGDAIVFALEDGQSCT